MLKVSNMTSEASGRKVANQFIIEDGNKTTFQSYSSPIVEIDVENKTLTVYPHWDYSMTTGKYRNMFMDDYGFYYMSDKKGFEECMKAGKTMRGSIEYVIKVA